jgi:hypothetical protein
MRRLRAQSKWELRSEELNGRQYIVVPVVPLATGVHVGMDGQATYYPADELATAVTYNNGRPVVIYHPEASANDPTVLQERGVGMLYNLRFDDGKWRADAWFDVERMEAVSPGLLDRIKAGELIEVSSGVYGRFEAAAGTWNGETYEVVAHTIVLDHLAILPAATGACSVADGCGIHANKSMAENNVTTIPEGTVIDKIKALFGFQGTAEERARNAARMKRQIDLLEMSLDDLWPAVYKAVSGLDNTSWSHWVREVYDSYVIYEATTTNPNEGEGPKTILYKRSYTKNDDLSVSLGDDTQEVKEQREYVPVNNEETQKQNCQCDKEKKDMQKEQKVKALIACERTKWAPEDEQFLMGLTDDQLDKMTVDPPKEEPKAEPPKVNEEKPEPEQKQTFADLLANAAPEDREMWARFQERAKAEKARLIGEIRANAACQFSEEELGGKSISDLQKIAGLAKPRDYSGSSAAPTQNAEPPMPPPLFEVKK